MKLKIIIASLIGIVSLFACSSKEGDDRGYIVKVGDQAPDFTTTLDNGSTFTLSENIGKVVMIQFTASWCGVCMKEMPFIESEIWKQHQDKGLVVIGVDRDEPIEKLIKFKEKTRITYPLGLDPGADIFGLYALKDAGVTRNVIVDKEGKIAYMTRLFNQEEFAAMKAKIEELLNQ